MPGHLGVSVYVVWGVPRAIHMHPAPPHIHAHTYTHIRAHYTYGTSDATPTHLYICTRNPMHTHMIALLPIRYTRTPYMETGRPSYTYGIHTHPTTPTITSMQPPTASLDMVRPHKGPPTAVGANRRTQYHLYHHTQPAITHRRGTHTLTDMHALGGAHTYMHAYTQTPITQSCTRFGH